MLWCGSEFPNDRQEALRVPLTLDRLTHRVRILEANGESYRLSDATRRLKRK